LRRNQPRGQSRNAVRCAVLSTFALIGSAVAQGTPRALLAFTWVVLLIAALVLEWSARRRWRAEQAVQEAKRRPPRAGDRAVSRTRARRAR
jgi:uncharacterized membrane protein YfcA